MRIGRSGKRCWPKAGQESAKLAPRPISPRLRGTAKCAEDFCATRPTYTKAEPGEIAAGMAQAMPAALLQAVC
jgi:hypothetical protein